MISIILCNRYVKGNNYLKNLKFDIERLIRVIKIRDDFKTRGNLINTIISYVNN